MRKLALSTLAVILLAGYCLVNTVHEVSAAPIDQDTFWARLQRTAQLVQQAIDSPASRQDLLQQVQDLWQGADSLRLSDAKGTLIPLDLAWVREAARAASSGDPASLKSLETRLQ